MEIKTAPTIPCFHSCPSLRYLDRQVSKEGNAKDDEATVLSAPVTGAAHLERLSHATLWVVPSTTALPCSGISREVPALLKDWKSGRALEVYVCRDYTLNLRKNKLCQPGVLFYAKSPKKIWIKNLGWSITFPEWMVETDWWTLWKQRNFYGSTLTSAGLGDISAGSSLDVLIFWARCGGFQWKCNPYKSELSFKRVYFSWLHIILLLYKENIT